jgi:hypothetical protein
LVIAIASTVRHGGRSSHFSGYGRCGSSSRRVGESEEGTGGWWHGVAHINEVATSIQVGSTSKVGVTTHDNRVERGGISNKDLVGAGNTIKEEELSLAGGRSRRERGDYCGGGGGVTHIDVVASSTEHGSTSEVDVAALHG